MHAIVQLLLASFLKIFPHLKPILAFSQDFHQLYQPLSQIDLVDLIADDADEIFHDPQIVKKNQDLLLALVLSPKVLNINDIIIAFIANDHQLWIESVHSGFNGVRTNPEPSVKWITQAEQYIAFMTTTNKHKLADNATSIPPVDFEGSWVLLIEMGKKSTGGYRLSLNKALSFLSNKTAVICINWDTPKNSAAVTQVVTSPYLMLRLLKGNFKKIVVVDQEEKTLFAADVPK